MRTAVCCLTAITLLALNVTTGLSNIVRPADLQADLRRIEQSAGPFSLELVTPLVQLGDHYQQTGSTDEARAHYLRAQHILHRHEGVHTPRQLPVIESLTRLALQQGDINQGTALYRLRYEINEKHYGHTDPRAVLSLIDLAHWLNTMGEIDRAGALFQAAIDSAGRSVDHGRLRAMAQTGLLETQFLAGHCCDDELIQAALDNVYQDPGADLAERQTAAARSADFEVMAGHRKAQSRYHEFAGLAGDPGQISSRPEPLGASRLDRMVRAYTRTIINTDKRTFMTSMPPGMLVGSPLPFCADIVQRATGTSDFEAFSLTAEIDISKTGRVRKIRILESSAPRRLQRLFRDVTRVTRFRPAIEAGRVVDSTIRLTQEFGLTRAAQAEDAPQFPVGMVAAAQGCHLIADIIDPDRRDGPRVVLVQ